MLNVFVAHDPGMRGEVAHSDGDGMGQPHDDGAAIYGNGYSAAIDGNGWGSGDGEPSLGGDGPVWDPQTWPITSSCNQIGDSMGTWRVA